MKTTKKMSLLILIILGILANVTACGPMNNFAHSGPGKALYYGLNAVRNPVGTAVALSAGAAAGLSAAKVKESVDSEKRKASEETTETVTE